MDHHAATSIFWEMRLTGYLVLFWYLSLRNAYRYSDPSVWEGRFIDEVRLLTAMKQNLKQIKRHFPQLDSCFFQLAQVLHLKTESGTDSRKEGCAYTLMHMFGRNAKHFFFRFVSALRAGVSTFWLSNIFATLLHVSLCRHSTWELILYCV